MTHDFAQTPDSADPRQGSVSHGDRHDRLDRLDRVPWPAVAVFIAVSFALAWLVVLPLWLLDLEDPQKQTLGTQLLAQAATLGMMFTPLIATLIVVFLTKTPRVSRARFLGLWPLRPAKRVVWFIIGGLVAPVALIALSLVIAVAFGWLTLDLDEFSGFAEALGGAPIGMSVQALVLIQLLLIPFGAIVNMIPAFGEEIGWRGWLLPALLPLGTWPALLASGVIWGLWHSPVILLGHNFGLFDWRGVALMTIGCVLWGVLLGWSRLRSGSVWPAVIGHGAMNAAAGAFGLFAAAGADLTLALVNPLGVAGWIAVAIAIAVLVAARQFGSAPQLAPSRSAHAAAEQ